MLKLYNYPDFSTNIVSLCHAHQKEILQLLSFGKGFNIESAWRMLHGWRPVWLSRFCKSPFGCFAGNTPIAGSVWDIYADVFGGFDSPSMKLWQLRNGHHPVSTQNSHQFGRTSAKCKSGVVGHPLVRNFVLTSQHLYSMLYAAGTHAKPMVEGGRLFQMEE